MRQHDQAPNHALQRTGAAVTPAASTAAFPPATQRSRQPRRSLSLGSLGDLRALLPMKIFLILLVAVTTISASAADRRRKTEVPKPDSLASAVDFARAFYAELNREVTLHPFNTGGGGDIGNIHNREWTYRIPANAFAPKQLSALALRAHKRWNTNWAGAGGQGGGGNQFSAQAFATGVFVFIDVIAYTESDDTVILLLARCAG